MANNKFDFSDVPEDKPLESKSKFDFSDVPVDTPEVKKKDLLQSNILASNSANGSQGQVPSTERQAPLAPILSTSKSGGSTSPSALQNNTPLSHNEQKVYDYVEKKYG